MDKDQSVSSQAVLDILQQEKIEIANSLTLSRARNQELFKEVVRLTEKLKELGVDDIDTISLDEFDPTRYGFSKGGIANKDMVRFLFNDNVRN